MVNYEIVSHGVTTTIKIPVDTDDIDTAKTVQEINIPSWEVAKFEVDIKLANLTILKADRSSRRVNSSV